MRGNTNHEVMNIYDKQKISEKSKYKELVGWMEHVIHTPEYRYVKKCLHEVKVWKMEYGQAKKWLNVVKNGTEEVGEKTGENSKNLEKMEKAVKNIYNTKRLRRIWYCCSIIIITFKWQQNHSPNNSCHKSQPRE